MHTLQQFFFHNEAISYVLAGVVLIAFIGWWLFLTDREAD